jgi:3-hydroxy-9,10-secoandrosta-1,3,5(10)-triene-9,17-dione monooxygenase
MTTIGATATPALEATRALVPELRARSAQTALDRRLPPETIAALRTSGALKTIQAKRNGGAALSMHDHLDMVSTIARGCGSTAWVAGVVQAHSWLISHFPGAAQDDIYGTDTDTVVAAVVGPRGTAKKVPGGYRLSGVWPFASGSEVAEWLLLGAVVVDDGEAGEEGDFAVPASALKYHDDWRVVGLSGTGSCTVSAEDVLIPEHRFLSFRAMLSGESPGMALHDGWLERCAPVPVLTLALTGSAIGIARQALDDFPPLIKGKAIVYGSGTRDEHPVTHVDLAEAVMKIEQGELLLYRAADAIDRAARESTPFDLQTRARLRLDCAEGVRRCLEGVEILFQLSGASGLRESSPLTRAVADLRAINQHGLLDLRTNREMYGRIHLGLEPNSGMI